MMLSKAINIISKEILKSDITKEEREALKALIIHAHEQEYKNIEPWYCSQDCVHITEVPCKGKHGVMQEAKRECPYYIEEDK